MYLKGIETYGFKSFSSKVKFSLKPGITGVIGPNGCGKSNIVDSIRWCIGEMSWKSLRSPSMMDVIFSGTAKKQPLNMAEVTMTFNNEDRRLPLDFKEVSVTRKMYRSNESEYFINKVQCRLKDIREMFLDTGIGSEGYAIIDQGEVEFVLSTTPEQRREMFEEASGVSKYKAKREEAIRKLEKVDLDLGRLADSIKLIGDQLKKLDNDAKKARLQQKYKEELKSAEIAMFSSDIKSFRKNISLENENLSPINGEIEEISSNITALDAELAALNITLAEKQEEEGLLREAVAGIISNKVSIEGKIISNEQLIEEIGKQLNDLFASEIKNNKELEDINPRLDSLKEKLKAAGESFLILKTEFEAVVNKEKGMGIEIEGISNEISGKENSITDVYQQERNVSDEMVKMESSISHLENDVLEANKEIEKCKIQKNDLERKRDEIKEALSNLSAAFEEGKISLSKMEGEERELEEKAEKVNLSLAETRTEKARSESRLETILMQGEKDSYWVGLNAVLNSGLPGIKGTLRHLITVRKEDSLIVEESIGKFLDSVICENIEDAHEAIKYLKHLGKGRCRFIALNKVASSDLFDLDIPNAVKIMDKISCPEEYKALVSNLLKNIYALEGSVLGAFWISGGIAEVNSNEPYWEEENPLKEKIKALVEREASLISEKENLLKNLADIEVSIEDARQDIGLKNINIEKTKSESAQAEQEYEVALKSMEFEESVVKKHQEEIKINQENLALSKSKKDELIKLSEGVKNEISELRLKKNGLLDDFSKLKEEMGRKRNMVDSHENNINALKEETERTEKFKARLISENEQCSLKKEESEGRIEVLKRDIENAKKNLFEVRNDLAEKEMLEKQVSTEINDLRSKYNSLNSQIRNAKEALGELEKKNHEIEIKISAYSARMDDLERRLIDDWNISEEEAAEKYGDIEVDAERVKFLKKRIENMGPVNMTAPQEYDALINRYNFMNSQVEDLNVAKNDLKSAISRINETTRVNFKATFDKVKVHFSQIYNMLFSGGEANLILTMPDNLLETGVEIMANPPGKRPVNISQLSGGEKALTALALLFSFFCVNPAPFCVMDEADAALDDANVERFVRLIKEFSKTTQFIVITHNKKTMEATDTLYGVTMEEPGVSKLISVDLQKSSAFIDSSSDHEPVAVK